MLYFRHAAIISPFRLRLPPRFERAAVSMLLFAALLILPL